MLIQVALLLAVQLQPVGVVTLTVLLPPSDVNDWLVGESVKLQDMPPCVTVKVCPAIVSVPVRVLVLVLASTT